MKIIKGKINKAQKVVVYGPEGIGKSTIASKMPNPLFIDLEGSTSQLDVSRTEKPSSWTMLVEVIKGLIVDNMGFKSLIIDTIDYAETMCNSYICGAHDKTSIEDFGYGKGIVMAAEEFGRFLDLLSELTESGVNVVLLAHAHMRKFEQPDEMGAYDRWELKLSKKNSPLAKEWADMVLFCNYKTIVIEDNNNKKKAQGGHRVMHTQHHPCWDAKNRHNLPDEIEMNYKNIEHCFTFSKQEPANVQKKVEVSKPEAKDDDVPYDFPEEKNQEPEENRHEDGYEDCERLAVQRQGTSEDHAPTQNGIRHDLWELMNQSVIIESELKTAVALKFPGTFPEDMPVKDYPGDFLDQAIIPRWANVVKFIKEDIRKN